MSEINLHRWYFRLRKKYLDLFAHEEHLGSFLLQVYLVSVEREPRLDADCPAVRGALISLFNAAQELIDVLPDYDRADVFRFIDGRTPPVGLQVTPRSRVRITVVRVRLQCLSRRSFVFLKLIGLQLVGQFVSII